MKLSIELVPQSSFYTNLRSMLPKVKWDEIRKEQYKKSKYTCDVCGGIGDRWPVECHEIWEYDDKNHIQKLVGFTSLCPACHEVKHIGLAGIRGRHEQALQHLMAINNISKMEATICIEEQFSIWHLRSQRAWEVDITLIKGE